jgi:WD40 repeat protein/serine/threonine protein kinase
MANQKHPKAEISPELKAIFCEALDCPSGAERREFLERACAGDQALRARIDALLAAGHDAGDFLEQPVPAPSTTWNPPEPLETSGTIIGPYKLLEQIGEGGMGTVYMAEQQQPVRRKVALKIIKPGMDSRQVIARFEAERQALAMMDHQNIARVLDAGTTGGVEGGGWRVAGREENETFPPSTRHAPPATPSGRPYFVMELVHGVPITQFCDDRKLTLRERLELLVPVCQAIQHAHQKGIIHRDIKPSNVLVTMYDDKPVPKVIDFGVAKAVEHRLTEKTMFTQFGALVGTFEYMSPEQAEMNAFGVDTRSDIYSLGVLLYELLTGTTPLEQKRLREAALTEMVRLIKEEEAPRPSVRLSSSNNLPKIAAARNTDPGRLSGIVRGELDWIVMKCLEKDRTRRYESASGLARDIQRYLVDEPVEACPPSAGYRLRKFARKYRTPLRVAGAFALLLTLAAVASTWQAIRATVAERVAQNRKREADEARGIAEKRRDEVAVVNQNLKQTMGDLRLALYVSDLSRAYKSWDEGNVQRVEELLERHRPTGDLEDLRGVEWYYLRRLSARLQAGRIADAQSAVTSVAISPDGKSVATSSRNGAISAWDASTGGLHFAVPDASAVNVAYTADGRALIAASRFFLPKKSYLSVTLRLRGWDIATGSERRTPKVELEAGEYGQATITSDGNTLIGFTPDGKLRLWQSATGKDLMTLDALASDPSIPRDHKQVTAITPDGKTLAWAMGGTMMVWDLTTQKIRFKRSKADLAGIYAVAFSPDGKILAHHRGGPPHVVELWDWSAGKLIGNLQGFRGTAYAIAFSPDGKLLATGDEFSTVRLWETTHFKEVAALKGHGGEISGLVFARDGEWLYSVGTDGLVRRWKPDRQADPDTIEGDHELYPVGIGFTADAKTLFVVSYLKSGEPRRLELKRWDLASGRELSRFQAIGFADISSDGSRAVIENTTDRNLELWDVLTNTKLASLESKGLVYRKENFSPDGQVFALCGPNQIKLWDTQDGKLLGSIKTTNAVSIAFSPDRRTLGVIVPSAGNHAPSVTLWDAEKFTLALELPGPATGFAFSPDGRVLAAIYGDVVTVWDIGSRHKRAMLKLPHPVSAPYVAFAQERAFSPDGKLFITVDDFYARFWDTTTWDFVGALKGPREGITDFAWSPDGKTLATITTPTVKLWNVATREELTTLTGQTSVRLLDFAPDGTLVWGDNMNSIRLWRPTSGRNAR